MQSNQGFVHHVRGLASPASRPSSHRSAASRGRPMDGPVIGSRLRARTVAPRAPEKASCPRPPPPSSFAPSPRPMSPPSPRSTRKRSCTAAPLSNSPRRARRRWPGASPRSRMPASPGWWRKWTAAFSATPITAPIAPAPPIASRWRIRSTSTPPPTGVASAAASSKHSSPTPRASASARWSR